MFMDKPDKLTGTHLTTFPACLKPFSKSAFPYFTIIAVGKLDAFLATSQAVDCFNRKVGCTEHFLPGLGSGFSKFIIIPDGGNPGITGFTIKSATGNKVVHCFKGYKVKNTERERVSNRLFDAKINQYF